jgi:HSP20 family protein
MPDTKEKSGDAPSDPNDPFRGLRLELREMIEDLDEVASRLARTLGPRVRQASYRLSEEFSWPYAEVLDQGHSYEVRVDVPGIPKDRIQVQVSDLGLDISAPPMPSTGGGASEYRSRGERGVHRQVHFVEPVASDQAEAKLENGVLTVTVPKLKPPVEHRVPVQ